MADATAPMATVVTANAISTMVSVTQLAVTAGPRLLVPTTEAHSEGA